MLILATIPFQHGSCECNHDGEPVYILHKSLQPPECGMIWVFGISSLEDYYAGPHGFQGINNKRF